MCQHVGDLHISGTSVFQVTMALCYKVLHKEKDLSNGKKGQDFTVPIGSYNHVNYLYETSTC